MSRAGGIPLGLGRRAAAAAPRAFTVLEVLIAVVVSSAFLAGLLAAFVQVLQGADRAGAVMRAIANGRTALDAMGKEIKQANYFPGQFYFQGINNFNQPLNSDGKPYGDGIDNDQDGKVDEERPDALDDDVDWAVEDDRHAVITGSIRERAAFVGQADLGDAHVDQDVVFGGDLIQFVRYADPTDPTEDDVEIAFYLGTYEERDHVLLKRTRTPPAGPGVVETLAPLAEGVLGFNALYWQPNGPQHYWHEFWDSNGPQTLLPPKLRLPAAVDLTVYMYADDRPIERYRPGEPCRVETVSTVATIEQVIQDVRYPRP